EIMCSLCFIFPDDDHRPSIPSTLTTTINAIAEPAAQTHFLNNDDAERSHLSTQLSLNSYPLKWILLISSGSVCIIGIAIRKYIHHKRKYGSYKIGSQFFEHDRDIEIETIKMITD
ncbi:hypothetical protein chiPu_0016608, partial [Chiloscyllium punctatum]|nr:hypothetical protein [Chiloscyllium punctatum]